MSVKKEDKINRISKVKFCFTDTYDIILKNLIQGNHLPIENVLWLIQFFAYFHRRNSSFSYYQDAFRFMYITEFEALKEIYLISPLKP